MKPLLAVLALALAGACGDDGGPTGDGNPGPPDDSQPIVVDTDEDYDCTATVTGNLADVFVPMGATCRLQEGSVDGTCSPGRVRGCTCRRPRSQATSTASRRPWCRSRAAR